MARRKQTLNNLPKDRILYCERCGISFLWSGEEQQIEQQTYSGGNSTPRYCAGCRYLLPSAGRERGIVKWYNPRKRFGFIVRADGSEIFAHGSKIRNKRHLPQDALVEFRVTETEQGPSAVEVYVLEGDVKR